MTLQLHGAVDELVDRHGVAAVRVYEREDDARLAGVDVQAGEVGLDPWVLEVICQLLVGERPRLVDVGLLEDPLDLLRGSPLVLREALHDLVLGPGADGAVDEDTGHHVEHADHAEADVEVEDGKVDLAAVQEPQLLSVHHPVVAAGDGAQQRDHGLVDAAEVQVHALGVLLVLRVVDVQAVEVAGHGAVEDDAEDEHDEDDHDKGPHHADKGVEECEHHGPEALQRLHRPHYAHDAHDAEDPQDAQEGDVAGDLWEHELQHGVEDQKAVEEVPSGVFTCEEGPLLGQDSQRQLDGEPDGEGDVGQDPIFLLGAAVEAAVAVLHLVVRVPADVHGVRGDGQHAEGAEHEAVDKGLQEVSLPQVGLELAYVAADVLGEDGEGL
mmetsp:Transcript_27666/g.86041  ORF Transcript_27666/g.86041 Transcript_27666/m.86041 type:complete len:382 (+) Transcript_27666:244-1389(+)